jgi:hypothetical protein
MKFWKSIVFFVISFFFCILSHADEGLWLLNEPPTAQLKQKYYLLQMSSDVNDIVNLTAMTVIEAQNQNAAYPGSISRFAQVAYESP